MVLHVFRANGVRLGKPGKWQAQSWEPILGRRVQFTQTKADRRWLVLIWGTRREPLLHHTGTPHGGNTPPLSSPWGHQSLTWDGDGGQQHQGIPSPVRADTGSKQPSPGQSSAAGSEWVLTSSLWRDTASPGPGLFQHPATVHPGQS